MKFHYFSYKATIAILVLFSFTFFIISSWFDFKITPTENFYLRIAVVIIFLTILLFIFINYILNNFNKNQLNKITSNLPSDFYQNTNEELTFQSLNDKVTELSKKRTSEMISFQEMENYRKEYIGNVSHELKTPLFSIQGYVSTLMDGGVENLEIRDKYLERIDRSVDRLLSIVKDLDMINRYETGEINLKITNFDINALIRENIELMEYEAEQKNATILLQSSQKEAFVNADKQKISQVLINLMSNAIYYSNRNQALITVKTTTLGSKIFIVIEDNGMGIKPEALPRIFERFYRVETSRSRREGGSGLGLAIVKHILEAHNQNIKVESKYLEGAKFSFMLDRSTF